MPIESSSSTRSSWLGQIPFDRIERGCIERHEQLFNLVCSASFIEITSDLYTRSLVALFAGDAEAVDWLTQSWEPEELEHGAALKRYVQLAWPDFDWEAGYRSFFAEYSQICSIDNLAPTRARELAARCVVETGTSTFYRMVEQARFEPVLTEIARRIANDEVRHYKYFYQFFRRYRDQERQPRTGIVCTLVSRTADVKSEDAFIAFKHAFMSRHSSSEFDPHEFAVYRTFIKRLAQAHFPHEMAVKMLLKPADLDPMATRFCVPLLTSLWALYLGW